MKKSIDGIPFKDQGFAMDHLFKADSEKVFVLSFKPGQSMPVHKHPGHNLYVLGYEGEGQLLINGQVFPCKKGDVFSAAPEDEFGIENNGDGNFRLFCLLSKRE